VQPQAFQFFSLQLGEPAAQLREAANLPIIDWTPELRDWADTAALIANLDVVVTCCTAVAHLAGALGKPTWILLHSGASWRWFPKQNVSPWYPTARLFWQHKQGDWSGAVLDVQQALLSMH
jgi:ADP-heptose:LPS heptosyltransferase